jgi:hypothetical protein
MRMGRTTVGFMFHMSTSRFRGSSPVKGNEELERYCANENLYLVVGCDPNEHIIECGSTNCNNRGEVLVEFLNSSNLEILNQGNEYTFYSGAGY